MNHAYLFPFGVEIDRAHTDRAMLVSLTGDHTTLVRAARHRRLRCPYGSCLEPVTLVHEAGSTRLRCFAHLPAGPDSPFCPYRTYRNYALGGAAGGRAAYRLAGNATTQTRPRPKALLPGPSKDMAPR